MDQRKFADKLQGKRVLIVGGTSGIGYAVAEGCVEAGSIVYVASSSAERVASAVASLCRSYPSAADRVHGHECSLNQKDRIEANVKSLFEAVGAVDHVVYTAGDIPQAPSSADGQGGVHAATVDDTIALGMVRFFAAQIMAKHAARHMPSSPSSSITLTTGSQSERPLPGFAWATGVAAAIPGLARGLAVDLAPIRVNTVTPGPVQTAIFNNLPAAQREATQKKIQARTLTGRIADPVDTAEAYLFLLRDRSCTGTVVHSDSGTLLT